MILMFPHISNLDFIQHISNKIIKGVNNAQLIIYILNIMSFIFDNRIPIENKKITLIFMFNLM